MFGEREIRERERVAAIHKIGRSSSFIGDTTKIIAKLPTGSKPLKPIG